MTDTPWPQVRATVFDLDDTLLDWRRAEHEAIGDLVAAHFETYGEPRVRAAYQTVVEDNVRAFKATGKWWYVADRLNLLLERLGAGHVDPQALVADFQRHVHARLTLLPGALEALAAAREAGPVGLLTNGPSVVQRPKLVRLDLTRHFDAVAVTGEIGHWKPDERAFLHILRELGAEATATLMVGDSLEFDLIPAKRLGMGTLWINPHGTTDPSADRVVATPGEAVPLLSRLRKR